MRKQITSLMFAVFALIVTVSAQSEQPKPMPNTYIHDFAGVVSADKQAEINTKAKQLKDEYKTEIALVTIDSLNGEDQFDYSMRMARSWGIGSPDNDVRGLLILIAVKDHKTSFRTSRHIEGEIPDGVTGEVSRTMNAFFKKGDFGNGLSAGMDKILARLQAVNAPPQEKPAGESSGLGWLWLLIIGLPATGAGTAFGLWRRGKKREEEAARVRRIQESVRQAARTTMAERETRRIPPVVDTSVYRQPRAVRPAPPKPTPRRDDTRPSFTPSYSEPNRSSDWSSSSDSGSSSSSSSSDSSYSGGSDFGGGGSDSSW